MPLLKTIADYLVVEKKPIIIRPMLIEGGIIGGIVFLSNGVKQLLGCNGVYDDLLHEFIHLDNLKVSGNLFGYCLNGETSDYLIDRSELMIERQVEEHREWNSFAYRFLIVQLQNAIFSIQRNRNDYLNNRGEKIEGLRRMLDEGYFQGQL